MKILQIGLGGFGKFHLDAWIALGMREQLFVCDASRERLKLALDKGIPPANMAASVSDLLDQAAAVDIVTPTDSHAPLATQALLAGKDVFLEKPMTPNSREALELHRLAAEKGRILQVGYYYRVHPISEWMKAQITGGMLGEIRYVSGDFLGFKRCRTDVGVTHTDAIHFLDLINWLLDAEPVDVFAVIRDHFNRKLEDLSVVLLTYPGGIVANVESGYIQPGRWSDRVVPHAKTTKALTVCGSKATIEADFEAGTVELFEVRHELRDGVRQLVNGGSRRPAIAPLSPVDQVRREMEVFLECTRTRQQPAANSRDSGVRLAQLMEAIYQSAAERKVVPVPTAESVTLASTATR